MSQPSVLAAPCDEVDAAFNVNPLNVIFFPSLTRLNHSGLLIILMFWTTTLVAWKRVKVIGRRRDELDANASYQAWVEELISCTHE